MLFNAVCFFSVCSFCCGGCSHSFFHAWPVAMADPSHCQLYFLCLLAVGIPVSAFGCVGCKLVLRITD